MSTPMSFDDKPPSERSYARAEQSTGGAHRPVLFVATVAALAATIFAAISTSDFIQHLDRQVHGIHCSFIPGAAASLGESGCRTVMMSPYSSLFRDSMWGGLPISLLAVAVFAYLVMKNLQMALAKSTTRADTLFLVAAWLLPVLMSAVYGNIAVNKIGVVCNNCLGIYITSIVGFVLALVAWRMSPSSGESEMPVGRYAAWFGEGVLYVVVLTAFYVLFAPATPKVGEGCGTLAKREDSAGVFIPMTTRGTPAIEVLDPLCPACKGFDERMSVSGLHDKLATTAVLFPLDSTCNWMVKESMHPGACAVSEAMLCDKDGAADVLAWAFAEQERLREGAKQSDAALRAELEQKFPKVKGCLGTPAIKNKLNKSLRWAVSNALPVLTPQLFIGDKRVCDEDTDLGLEFTVTKMLEGSASGRK